MFKYISHIRPNHLSRHVLVPIWPDNRGRTVLFYFCLSVNLSGVSPSAPPPPPKKKDFAQNATDSYCIHVYIHLNLWLIAIHKFNIIFLHLFNQMKRYIYIFFFVLAIWCIIKISLKCHKPAFIKGEVQSRITIISKERVKISLQIGAKIMKIG